MKKIILTAAAVFAFSFANAQDGGFKLGAHVGLPMGDIKDFSSLNIGADVAYVWKVADSFDAGITTGYTTYLGKDGADATGFIPVAATGQYAIADNLFLGADLGYAVYAGSEDGAKGGFLYQPKFGYKAEKMELYLGYKGISQDGGTFSSVNIGVNYKL
jgi:hypothetical protein